LAFIWVTEVVLKYTPNRVFERLANQSVVTS
jgi:hypothetical protein